MAFGSLLTESQDSSSMRKERGAFFTPPEMARMICDALIHCSHDRVLEPACGEGVFLGAAADRLRSLGASSEEVNKQVCGCELHAETIQAAKARLHSRGIAPSISEGDFFSIDTSDAYDAVVGNPPYIRYQEFSGEQRQLAQKRALEQGVTLSSLSSSWAPFVIHACGFLRKGGSLGMVLPAELMSSNYAGPVRSHLLSCFSHIDINLYAHSVFPDVEEEVIVLIAQGYRIGKSERIRICQHETLARDSAESVFCSVSGDARWPLGEAGSRAAALLSELDGLSSLADWGRIRLGAVTGANGYFCLSRDDVDRYELGSEDIMRFCPAGSAHLRGLDLDTHKMREMERAGKKVFLFYPRETPSLAAASYIAYGESLGVNQHFKCRTRKPWWRVPSIGGCDLFVTYMNGVGPNLCANELGLAFTNSVHGLTLDKNSCDLGKAVLPLSYHSTVSQLSAEVFGRSYGGGILKIEPREAAKTLVPSKQMALELQEHANSKRAEVQTLLAAGRREEVRTIADKMLINAGIVSHRRIEEASSLLCDLRARRAKRSSRTRKER